jgi:hypothetical protein
LKRARPTLSNKIKRAPQGPRHFAASPVQRLRSKLSANEYTAADEILAAFRIAAGLPVARDPDLGIPLAPNPGAADDHAAKRFDIDKVYPIWRRDLRDTVQLRIADAVLFSETPLAELDAANRWRKGTARSHLDTALRHFAALRGNAPRGEQWKFTTKPPTRKENTK